MIRLKCLNDICGYSYEVTQKELEDNSQYYKLCLLCKSKLEIAKESLEEIIEKDLYTRAEEYINIWVAEIGWDNVLDLLARNKTQSCYRIYAEILRKKGFILK
jgi:hypothetical protein